MPLQALSLPSADDVDDGWTEMGGRMSASMTFCISDVLGRFWRLGI